MALVSLLVGGVVGYEINAGRWFRQKTNHAEISHLVQAQTRPTHAFTLHDLGLGSFSLTDHSTDSGGGLREQLAAGGLMIHVRHAERSDFTDIWVLDAFSLYNNAPQAQTYSCLSDSGKVQAEITGWVFKKADIPVSQAYSSPSCRALEHARISGVTPIIVPELLYPQVFPERERAEFESLQNAFLLRLLNNRSLQSGVIILFGHDAHPFSNLDAVKYQSKHNREMGGLTIFRPDRDNQTWIEVETFSTLTNFYAEVG